MIEQRPLSIAELRLRSKPTGYDGKRSFRTSLRIALDENEAGLANKAKGDIEQAYIHFSRAYTLLAEELPTHPRYPELEPHKQEAIIWKGHEVEICLNETKALVGRRILDWKLRHLNSPLEPRIKSDKPLPNESLKSDGTASRTKYTQEGLRILADRWGCNAYFNRLNPNSVSHSVLGTVFLEVPQISIQPPNYRALHLPTKSPQAIGVTYTQSQHISDLEDTTITKCVRRLIKYSHPNVLSLLGIQLTPQNGVGLVFPQTSTQSLREHLNRTLDVDRCQLCAQVSSGLDYLHTIGVVHGRLRAEHILVSAAGMAILSDPIVLGGDTHCGGYSEFRWMAPEVSAGGPPSPSSDVYSLGMTILEIITGAVPYAERSDAEVVDGLSRRPLISLPERPEDSISQYSEYGNMLWRLLLDCWSYSSDRPTIALVYRCMKSITQDGLKRPSQEKINAILFEVKVLEEESYYLSDIRTDSSSSSGASLSHDDASSIKSTVEGTREGYNSKANQAARGIIRRLALHGCENLTDHINEDSFSRIPLFRGGFGDVYRGNLLGDLQVAIKTPQISLSVLEENAEYIKDVAREIHTWSKCNHPNVLHFLGLAVFRGQIGMVAPWMKYGSLPRYLEKTLSTDRCKLCTQVCEGVTYLHQIGIVHGDLKGENVLVSTDGVAVVSDFGGSLLKNRSLKILPAEKGLCLTYRWAAPELLMQGGISELDEPGSMSVTRVGQTSEIGSINTRESDIYALGMTILEVISGRLPWYWIKHEPAIILRVSVPGKLHTRPKNEIPTHSRDGDKLWKLLAVCWSFEPATRPTAAEVGDVMKTTTPGGLKSYPSATTRDRCALSSALQ